ncbi:MAG TPA: TRAP transporter small permease [Burkholderiales bacterium]|nr:TRAP transporter small permease [Burkholderiales bacterium]
MPIAEGLVRRINLLVQYVVIAQFSVLVTVVAAAVFWRYVLNDSIVWAEELSRYLFVWISFLGGGLGVGTNIHVGVDSIVELLPERPKLVVQIAVELLIVAFTTVLIWVGWQFMMFGMRSDALLLPIKMGHVYMAVPAGGVVMLLNVLLNVARHVRTLVERKPV